ncbi:hypothetical protein BKA66DRAFT_456970 [Pyrenochaeta sp. MPI-SDFR-AT-0127]|nr:hypothetical protein BKA66DRAFT_456970 [Pyrenochaeta sp. MPI-SDFR-AT-0127]
MTHSRSHRTRPSMPLMRLPPDVQLHILRNMDIHTLHTAINAIPYAKALYLRYPVTILQGATAAMGLQIRNLMMTTYGIIHRVNSGFSAYSNETLNDMSTFLASRLDTDGPRDMFSFESNGLRVIEALCKLDAEISCHVEAYAFDAYSRACHHDNPGVAPPPLIISSIERHRITRAFYQLKLFGVLFYNYADRHRIDLQASYSAFFDRLSTFEVDEITTAYQYLLREGQFFISAYPHNNCSYVPVKPYRGCLDPFNCETCRGRCLGPSNPLSPWWRGVQPFWHGLICKYVDPVGLWAEPAYCRQTPIKIWDDMQRTNKPNAGWLLWCDYRELPEIERDTYVREFRNLGYCFWDRVRLEGWGMFEASWKPQVEPCSFE